MLATIGGVPGTVGELDGIVGMVATVGVEGAATPLAVGAIAGGTVDGRRSMVTCFRLSATVVGLPASGMTVFPVGVQPGGTGPSGPTAPSGATVGDTVGDTVGAVDNGVPGAVASGTNGAVVAGAGGVVDLAARVVEGRMVVAGGSVVFGVSVVVVDVGASVGSVTGASTTPPVAPLAVSCTARTRAMPVEVVLDDGFAAVGRFSIEMSSRFAGTGGRTAFARGVRTATGTMPWRTGPTAASASRITTAPATSSPTTNPRAIFMTLE